MTKFELQRQDRKQAGLCVHCGGEFDSETHRLCLDKLKARRKVFKDSGLCRDCQQPLTSPQHHEKCIMTRRVQSGMCPKCKDHITSDAHKCCTEKQRAVKKKRYHFGIANDLCASHNRPSVIRGKCEECWYRSIARGAFGTKHNWVDLKHLMEFQEFKCAYTGNPLIIGKNASIDHKIPIVRGGERTLQNIHWVELKVNKIKSTLTHLEFLCVCQLNWTLYQETKPNDDRTKLFVEIGERCNFNMFVEQGARV